MIDVAAPPVPLIHSAAQGFRPTTHVDSWGWINTFGRTPEGMPFDGERIPYAEGVCEAWDDPETREVVLMWGTRLGKTVTALQLMLKCVASAPRPGLFATSTQTLSKRTVRNKIYPALHACPRTRDQLPIFRNWTVEEIRLASSPWYVAWSGSPTQLADLSAYYGWANEIDKWTFNEAAGGETGEGDPLDQFLQRFKEFWNYKVIFECSPTTKAKSRIEKKFLASDQRRYHVPCPHCGEFQLLRLGQKNQAGGIRFDKLQSGATDPSVARQTARYECEHCEGAIYDQHRRRMVMAGQWLAKGQSIDSSGIVHGESERDKRIAGFQLSSLYSLQMTWGDIAGSFVEAKASGTQSLRMFINGTLGETWEPHRSKTSPEQVGARLSVKTKRGIVPEWATYLFGGIDQQEDNLVYMVLAVGPDERDHVVTHGECEDYDELASLVLNQTFDHEDGGDPMPVALSLLDSGFRTRKTYEFCRDMKSQGVNVWPCKGANSDCGGEAYQRKVIGISEGKTARTKRALIRSGRGLVRIRVNPFYYEPQIQSQLDFLHPGEPGSLSLHSECRDDTDFLQQMCNGAESKEPSKIDPDRHLWVKRLDKEPNDYRDTKKYARCAADVYFASNRKASINERYAVQAAEPVARKEAPARREQGRFRNLRSRGGGE